jgi:hypothetical protein
VPPLRRFQGNLAEGFCFFLARRDVGFLKFPCSLSNGQKPRPLQLEPCLPVGTSTLHLKILPCEHSSPLSAFNSSVSSVSLRETIQDSSLKSFLSLQVSAQAFSSFKPLNLCASFLKSTKNQEQKTKNFSNNFSSLRVFASLRKPSQVSSSSCLRVFAALVSLVLPSRLPFRQATPTFGPVLCEPYQVSSPLRIRAPV